MKKQKLLIIVGPTSSGKSALAVELARKFDGEVISADSRQVYRGLDIGTGKITPREMKGIPHHLLDVVSPKKTFTAHDFERKATKVIHDIAKRGHLPILAGGTGFYADVLVGRIVLPDVATDVKLRARLEKKSVADLFTMLKKKDPRRAKTIEPHNKRRLIRALEITAHAGKNPTPIASEKYDVLWIGIAPKFDALEKKIHTRLLARMKQGMIAEAKRLHAQELSYKRMEELGLEYRSLARFLQKKITKEEMIDELDRAIRKYAKRQISYWKRNKEIHWFRPDVPKLATLVKTFAWSDS